MNYTAKEIVAKLQEEGDSQISLRTVRYYTQQGLIPPLDKTSIKNYTEEHLNHIRALRNLSLRRGVSLNQADKMIRTCSSEQVDLLNSYYNQVNFEKEKDLFKTSENIKPYFKNLFINNELVLKFTDNVSPKTLNQIFVAINKILKEDNKDENENEN